jgi:isoleucyl-tRNA synthetase
VEAAKQEKRINNPLEAQVELMTDSPTSTALEPFVPYLPVIFKVSQVALSNGRAAGEGTAIRVEPAHGQKCARCWLVKTDVGTDDTYSDLCRRCADVIKTLPQNGD